MKLSIPLSYPEKFCVTILNLSFHSTDNTISNDSKVLISNELDVILSRNNGEEVLFDAINYLRERISVQELSGTREQRRETGADLESTGCISTSDSEFSSSNVQYSAPSQSIRVYHGEVTVEKKSQFLSHFAFVSSMEEVNEFRQIILADKKCSRATHNIFAFRFLCPHTGGQYCHV
jgi:hypothetical protein